MSEAKHEVQKRQEHSVEFVPFGASDKIRLSASMVKQFIAVPTASGALPTERDCIRFIMLCLGKRANPYEGDCYLIGYDTQRGPAFSLVCGIELFEKRAAAQPEYDGAEAGVIVQGKSGILIERAGTLVLQGETLIGGWAKIYRKDRAVPEYKSVALETYDTGRSRWKTDPGGMIAKVARSQALRAAFPIALGGLYTQEEMQAVTESGDIAQAAPPKLAMPKRLSEQQPEPPPEPEQTVEPEVLPPEVGTPPPPPELEIALEGVGEIKSVQPKEGKRPWRVIISTKQGAINTSTFSDTLGKLAGSSIGLDATYQLEQKGKFLNLVDLTPLEVADDLDDAKPKEGELF